MVDESMEAVLTCSLLLYEEISINLGRRGWKMSHTFMWSSTMSIAWVPQHPEEDSGHLFLCCHSVEHLCNCG